MTEAEIQAILDKLGRADRSPALALHALLSAADEQGVASFNDAATKYREDHLAALRASGRDAEREAGQLSMDQVREHLQRSVLPRLVAHGLVILPPEGFAGPDATIRFAEGFWSEVRPDRRVVAEALKETGEH